jgi:hypothetical protein|tara:strand:- start:92 stop:445 length:354 start_codon:yes stop_codon:yes gene_type:complete
MNIGCTHLSEKPKPNYKERGNSSLSDNLKYLNNAVSHIEINRFQGAGDIKYCVTAKALTINIVTGEKAFVIWAVQEHEDFETAVQNAKDELRNRIVVGAPVLQNASPAEDVKNLTSY